MSTLRIVALATGAAIVGVGGVVAINTARFGDEPTRDNATIKIAPAPAFDINDAANHLGEAIRFQTVSHQNPAENDKRQWAGFQTWMVETYPLAHRAMTREVIGGALYYTWLGSDTSLKPIILMAHHDVVPVTPGTDADWKHPAFSGLRADNAVWGRGAVDDKGSLVGLFEALEALARDGFKPRRSVIIVSGHDEEAGGSGAQAVAETLAARKIKAEFTIDEGSATLLDAPVINGPAILIGVAEKGYATLKVTANATGGHSSMPPKQTGVITLAKALIAINDAPFPLELRGPGADMLRSLSARGDIKTRIAMANPWLFNSMTTRTIGNTPSGAALLHTTIAPTMLQGSPKENVLPQSASGLINYRIAPWNSSADIMAQAKAAVATMPVTLAWTSPPREPSQISSTTSRGWQLIAQIAAHEVSGAPVAPYLVVAGTDSRSFSQVSEDVYRYMPVQLTLSQTAIIHGTNEHISINNLSHMVKFYAQLVATAAR